jgi:hypothetical protein
LGIYGWDSGVVESMRENFNMEWALFVCVFFNISVQQRGLEKKRLGKTQNSQG